MTTADKIQSIRETLAGGYKKPEPQVMENMCDALWDNTDALNYLKIKRGLTEETIRHFKLGYDHSKDAISIPVFKGKELVNIRYRFIKEGSLRYTQEKGCEVWLYNDDGIERGKAKKGVLIVEGEFDLMSAWQAGFKNVVSPASGKDSYGPWIELLDTIPHVFIAYDNDKAGKHAAAQMAERVGIDKSFELLYPDDSKDANDYFSQHTAEEFRKLLFDAKERPFYKHKFSGVGDILEGLLVQESKKLELDTVPFVRWSEDSMAVLSADSNGGKTTYALNIANELVEKDIPTLFLPFERGVRVVGPRFLQVRYKKQEEDLETITPEEVARLKEDSVNLPLYFSEPTPEEFYSLVKRAKRLFGIKFIIIDHLDYFISGDNQVTKQADFCKELKEFLIEEQIACIMVHHINKDKDGRRRKHKLSKEDLKGSSAIYQIPEVVMLLYPEDDEIIISIDKNKGKEGKRRCKVDMSTGRFTAWQEISNDEFNRIEKEAEEAWNG